MDLLKNLLTVVCLLALARGQRRGIRLTGSADPPLVLTGRTPSLTVNCNLPAIRGNNPASYKSLVLKSNDGSDSTVIASVDEQSQAQVHCSQVTGGGSLLSAGGTLFARIENPSTFTPDSYSCEATYEDDQGQEQKQEVPVDVGIYEPTVPSLLELLEAVQNAADDRFSGVRSRLLRCQREKDEMASQHANATSTTLEQCEAVTSELRARLAEHEAAAAAAIAARENEARVASWGSITFIVSDLYENHRYTVPRSRFTTQEAAQTHCVDTFGGYLAEINDEPEYTFVTTFLMSFNGAFAYPWLGTRKTNVQGVWGHLTNTDDPFYVNYDRGEPTAPILAGSPQDCLFFGSRQNRYAMHDGVCTNRPFHAVCEIPF